MGVKLFLSSCTGRVLQNEQMQEKTNLEWLLEGFRYDLELTVRPKTVDYYYGGTQRFIKWIQDTLHINEIDQILKKHIQSYFHFLANNNRTGLKNDPREIERYRWPYYRALRRFFGWAVTEGYLLNSPMSGIKLNPPPPTAIEPYYPEQIYAIFKVLDHDWKTAQTQRQKMLAARNRAIFMLFLESGLRLEELAKLNVDDVNLEKQALIVKFGKMGKPRMGGFGPQSKKALWKYLGLRSQFTNIGGLWITEEGSQLSVGGVQIIIRRLKKEAGLGHLRGSVHKLRHTFATTYLKHTRDMKGCRILLGHSTLAMTERYTQFVEAEDALKAYNGEGPADWIRNL
jgi:site-specific recombinase XerD